MNTRVAAILIIIVFLLVTVVGVLFWPYAISGYGGIASNIQSVEHSYPKVDAVSISIQPTVATVTPTTLGPIGASGLRLELGQPQYTGDEVTYHKKITQKTDQGDLIREWEVRIAYFDMSFTLTTDGGGILAIQDVNFWIELKENEFDVFTAADEVEAYILEVVTKEPVAINDPNNVKVSPAAGGYSFNLDPLSSEPIPSWMSDAGYQGVLSQFKDVRFMITAESMQPTQMPWARTENGATWHTEVRALVFGFWEVLSPYDEWEFKFYGWLDWLDDIFAGLELIVGLAVGVLLSVIILKFVPDKRLAAGVLIVLWAFVIVGFGFVEVLI